MSRYFSWQRCKLRTRWKHWIFRPVTSQNVAKINTKQQSICAFTSVVSDHFIADVGHRLWRLIRCHVLKLWWHFTQWRSSTSNRTWKTSQYNGSGWFDYSRRSIPRTQCIVAAAIHSSIEYQRLSPRNDRLSTNKCFSHRLWVTPRIIQLPGSQSLRHWLQKWSRNKRGYIQYHGDLLTSSCAIAYWH